jgi:hypothetical protein
MGAIGDPAGDYHNQRELELELALNGRNWLERLALRSVPTGGGRGPANHKSDVPRRMYGGMRRIKGTFRLSVLRP